MAVSKAKRLLLIAYFYPPLGGPAVQRPCKTVKYLTQLGWEVDVITVRDILYHSLDESLLNECRAHKVIRTASFDLMYLINSIRRLISVQTDNLYFKTSSKHKNLIKKFFPIDEKIGWYPFVVKAGREALLTNRYRAVLVSCGPFSAALAARRIARLGKIPLVMDYRDHWTLNTIVQQPQGMVFRQLQKLEQNLLNAADLVLTATQVMKQDLANEFGASLLNKIMPFYNGWDEADFNGLQRTRKPDGMIRIAYLGTLYADRSLKTFLSAFKKVCSDLPEQKIEFQLVGNFYPETYSEVAASGTADTVTFLPQQSHADALQTMLDSDILLLIIGSEKFRWILTGKLFEYIRSQRPVLALAPPNSEAAEILSECGHTAVCSFNDIYSIMAGLHRLIEKVQKQDLEFRIPSEYERSLQVQKLSERLLSL